MYDHLARQQQATVHAITRTHVFYITLVWAKAEHKEKPVNLDPYKGGEDTNIPFCCCLRDVCPSCQFSPASA